MDVDECKLSGCIAYCLTTIYVLVFVLLRLV